MTWTPPEAGRAAPAQARERARTVVPLPCSAPGKKRFLVDRDEFEVDEQYEVRRLSAACAALLAASAICYQTAGRPRIGRHGRQRH